jgi:hexulose-6-phosphate isomerase
VEQVADMKKSIGDNMIPKGWTLPEGLALIKKATYDGVDLWIGNKSWFQMTTTDAEVIQMRRSVEDAGLLVTNVSSELNWNFPISSPDKKVRDYGIRVVERQIEAAVLLGCNVVLVVPGTVNRDTNYNEVYKRSVEALQGLAPAAEKAQITIGCEPNTCYERFLLSPREFAQFLDDVGSPHVGVLLDTANAHDLGFAEQWIQILQSRMTQLHMRDTLYKRGHSDEDTTATCLFLGDNDWPAIRRTLDLIGYDGWLIAEPIPRYKYARDLQFYEAAAALDRFISRRF